LSLPQVADNPSTWRQTLRSESGSIEDDRSDRVRERQGIVLAWIHDKAGSCATERRAGQDKDANTYVIETLL